jgi:hypothetical protein
MLPLLKNLFHRPAIRFGMGRGTGGKFKDPRFASFMSQSNRKSLNTDFQDAVLRGRKMFRYALIGAVGCAAVWVAIESAHALSMF